MTAVTPNRLFHSLVVIRTLYRHARVSVAAMAFGLLGCGDDGGTDPNRDVPVAGVVVSPANDTVIVQGTLSLTATPVDSVGTALEDRSVSWSSSDTSLAMVSANGLVTARRIGRVTITATSETKSGTAELTLAPIVTVGRRHPSVFQNDTTLLTASLTDATGAPLSGDPPLWTSLTPDVATVSPGGVVTGVAPGYATISATVGGGTAAVDVAVLLPRIGVTREVTFLKEVQRSDGLHITELWVMQPDGSMPLRVSPAEEYVIEYAWAPDGEHVAVNYSPLNGIGRSGLYRLTADGTEETPVTTAAVHLRWSPDGTRIAYRTHGGDIYSIRPDGTDLRPLANLPGDELDPEWSPDGRQIAYRRAGAGYELWLMDADGSAKRHVPLPFSLNAVRWSPDGKYLAVATITIGLASPSGVWLVNADGTGVRALSPNCTAHGTCTNPSFSEAAWSPDGSRVALTIRNVEGTSTNIGVIDVGTLGLVEVPNGDGCCVDSAGTAQWSPDGMHLAFQTKIPVGNGYYWAFGKSLPNGSGAVILTGQYSALAPGWRP